MLLVLLYILFVWTLLFFRRTKRMTKEMPETLIQSIVNANPVCMAKMLTFHAHVYTSMDILLVLSGSEAALQNAVWPLHTDFATLQYISWMCPQDTSHVLQRIEAPTHAPHVLYKEVQTEDTTIHKVDTIDKGDRVDKVDEVDEKVETIEEPKKVSKKQNVKKVGPKRPVEKQDEGIVLEKGESP